jgi:hypothetical protein
MSFAQCNKSTRPVDGPTELASKLRLTDNFYESFNKILRIRRAEWATSGEIPNWSDPVVTQIVFDRLTECILQLKQEVGNMEDALNHIDPKWRSRGWIKDDDDQFSADNGEN